MDTRERAPAGGGDGDERCGDPAESGQGPPHPPGIRPRPPAGLRLARRLNRAYHRRLGRRTHDPRGVDVVAADWDVLVVLDACRPDALERALGAADGPGIAGEEADGPGLSGWKPDDVERRRSRGSHTVEFLWGNFAGRELYDAVYVTANVQPYVYREALAFHHVEHVWVDGFDAGAGTVPPDAVTDAALAAAERFPRKRLLVHYLQPHYPFLDGPRFEHGTMAFWDAVAAGAVDASREQLRGWHEANVRRALPAVERLLDGVGGRAVVTADHGTALGERGRPVPAREWGHPWGVYAAPLVEVPWLVRAGDGRRDVRADPPLGDDVLDVDGTAVDDGTVRARLAALGYA